MKRFLLIFCLLIFPAWADSDHEKAREALLRGEIMPLAQLLAKLEQDYPGQIIEVELEEKKQLFVYEIIVAQTNGKILKLYYNARNGELLKAKSK